MGDKMFITIAIIFIISGALLLLKAKRMSHKPELRIVIGVCGIIFIVLGIVLVYNLITGNIVLPLH